MRLLVTDPIHEEGIRILEEVASVDLRPGISRGKLLDILSTYEGLIIRSRIHVDKQLLDAGRSLRVIARAGVGIDNIDLETATERGIVVVNSPYGNVRAVAEHTVGLILAVLRNIPLADEQMHRGVWNKDNLVGDELHGKTIGIIGVGRIGSSVAQALSGFGVRLLGYDPFRISDVKGLTFVDLDELLTNSDIITLHTPHTALTRGMIGARELSLMKPSAILVNCARGELVVEQDLIDACRRGRLGGVALDTFSREPFGTSDLLGLSNVVCTPHIGGMTGESMRVTALEIAEGITTFLSGGTPLTLCNAEVLAPEFSPSTLQNHLSNWSGFCSVVIDLTTLFNGTDVGAQVIEAFPDLVEVLEALDAGGLHVTVKLANTAAAHSLVGRLAHDRWQVLTKPLLVPASMPHDRALQDAGVFEIVNTSHEGLRDKSITNLSEELLVRANLIDIDTHDLAWFHADAASESPSELTFGITGVHILPNSLAPVIPLAVGRATCEKMLTQRKHREALIQGLVILVRDQSVRISVNYSPLKTRLRRFCLQGV